MPRTVDIPIVYDVTTREPVVSPGFATGDVTIKIGAAARANTTNLPVQKESGYPQYEITLTDAELANVGDIVRFVDQATATWETDEVLIVEAFVDYPTLATEVTTIAANVVTIDTVVDTLTTNLATVAKIGTRYRYTNNATGTGIDEVTISVP